METIRHYSMLIGDDWAGQRLRHLGLSPGWSAAPASCYAARRRPETLDP
jgi:hypothetical protein